MRFCLKSLFIPLMLLFTHVVHAGEAAPVAPAGTANQQVPEPPAVIEADSLAGTKDQQIEATGKAKLRKGDQTISGERLLYQQDSADLDAQGDVVLEQRGDRMSGPHLQYNTDSKAGTMERPNYYMQEKGARGTADVLHIRDSQHFDLDNATYTTCPAGNDDWQMKMHTLQINRDENLGIAKHSTIEFMGVPILYTPWMDFPLGDRRKSGVLAPIIGNTTKTGTELTIPVYWNIADNYDATISPRYMEKRGLQLNNEFRYLGAGYGGEVHADVLPNDTQLNQQRARLTVKHSQALAPGAAAYMMYNRVTDDAYFRDLGNAVNTTSLVNLPQEVGASYNGAWWTSAARVQRFQTLQDPLAPIGVPYERLPQLNFGARSNAAGANLAMSTEYVAFSHATAINAQRTVLAPSVSYPLVSDPAYYLTPKLTVHSTHYAMGANNPGLIPDASRTLPLFSVDSGVAFERDVNIFGGEYLQTLEPRAYYVYVPYKDQSSLPVFDTAQADFNFIQMFTENRFIGNDRVGDADQVTLAATTRFLEQGNSTERLRLMVGERFSFANPKINFVTPSSTTGKSDILVGAAVRMTSALALDSEYQFDPNQSVTRRYNIAARYRPEAGKTVNFGYRFMRNTMRQIDVSTQWPLSARWYVIGRANYAFTEKRVLDSIAGLEYNESCWSLRLVAQYYVTATRQYNSGVFIQLELNDLAQVGADPLALLKRSVPGYTKMNKKSSDQPVTQPSPLTP